MVMTKFKKYSENLSVVLRTTERFSLNHNGYGNPLTGVFILIKVNIIIFHFFNLLPTAHYLDFHLKVVKIWFYLFF
ncbi:hypothetical protein SB763_32425, partial [Burkholderia sp. SIMBA_042]|uniref:hypothetical protein n=1 Tax=Burkholderia sp. SIMBA_042 TaxID=3085783 RepID=UPI00397C658B